MSGNEDAERSRRNYHAPYTGKHPIPTISKYREEKLNDERRKNKVINYTKQIRSAGYGCGGIPFVYIRKTVRLPTSRQRSQRSGGQKSHHPTEPPSKLGTIANEAVKLFS